MCVCVCVCGYTRIRLDWIGLVIGLWAVDCRGCGLWIWLLRRMDGCWIDGWMDRWMDGWIDGKERLECMHA